MRYNQNKQGKMRKFWLNFHLYLALSFGLLFVLLGLTGSINVFYRELDEWLYSELRVAEPLDEYRPWNEVMTALTKAYPDRKGSWTLRLPRYPEAMLVAVNFDPSKEKDVRAFINPYTAEITAKRSWGDTWGSWNYKLHSTLLLGDEGYLLVGATGMIFIISIGSGLYLWWPRVNKYKQSLTIKRRASFTRLIFDIHRVFGSYSFIVFFMLGFSGVSFVYGDEIIRPIVAWFSPIDSKAPHGGHGDSLGIKSTIIPGNDPITISAAVSIANQVFPDAELRRITTPDNPEDIYIIRKYQDGEANYAWSSTVLWIDQYSGQVIDVLDPNKFTAGETFLNVLFPLHSGEALGVAGRILVCITGLIPLFLYITGIIRWSQKRRNARKKYKRIQFKLSNQDNYP